jgi:hypothetical protein
MRFGASDAGAGKASGLEIITCTFLQHAWVQQQLLASVSGERPRPFWLFALIIALALDLSPNGEKEFQIMQ